MSVVRSVSQGKDLFIDFFEGLFIDDAVWTLLFESAVEMANFAYKKNRLIGQG